MKRIILASHGGMAAGVADTLRMVMGEIPNLHVLAIQRDDKETITVPARALMESFASDDNVYVLTDMTGSSVNNSMVELLAEYPNMTLISGMNMPLALTVAMPGFEPVGEAVDAMVEECRAAITNCSAALRDIDDEEDDL